ncbi:MAG: ATP-binding protein [Cyanobacteriota bacterium]|nr:ATP-binding protein [Cyanobacteriota bacterium]
MSRILVVEDDATSRLFLQRNLRGAGYEPIMTTNGLEGLERAREIHPALIICDWVMPLMDGIDVCRQVKSDPSLARTFFILLSSREAVADRIAGLDAGADDFLTKPVDPNELKARVRAGLRQHQLTEQLSDALRNLQQAQSQLVQHEKMMGLGQLVAGVAHELNNPVTFIETNLTYANNYLSDLLELLLLYRKHYPNPVAEIQDCEASIDFEFLHGDLPKLLGSMKMGTRRIDQIVQNLKIFARFDEMGIKRVDLHQGLKSTLALLRYSLQGKRGEPQIETLEDYSEMPPIECDPGQLNQAFLNIINNAIYFLRNSQSYACDRDDRITTPTIKIRTEIVEGDRARITIEDNGPGMTQEVRERIFDPFFTTKPVGQGTGMGLAICYQIIAERHRGQLSCTSTPGEGTQFAIDLPLRQSL